MNPTNTDKTPFIFRFLDSLGVQHTVVPSNHTHTMSEVTDLPAIETTPTANSTKLVTSGGIFAALAQKAAAIHQHVMSDITGLIDALAGKANAQHTHDKIEGGSGGYTGSVEVTSSGIVKVSGSSAAEVEVGNAKVNVYEQSIEIKIGDTDILINASDLASFRLLFEPDTYPTADSPYMVTSGGIWSCISNTSAPHNHFYHGTALDLDDRKTTFKSNYFRLFIENGSLDPTPYSSIFESVSGKSIVYADGMSSIPAQGSAIIFVYFRGSKYYIYEEAVFS